MTREEAIAELLSTHQPLGPFREPTDADERQEAWVRSAGLDVMDAMLELASHPAELGQTGRLSPAEFEFDVARMLSLLGARHPEEFLSRAALLLRDPVARPTLIDALGMMNSRGGMRLLASLISADLTEEEGVRLASALGELRQLGAEETLELLQKLRARTPESRIAVIDEIEIAMQLARLG